MTLTYGVPEIGSRHRKPPRRGNSPRAETQEVMAPVHEKHTPMDARASTPVGPSGSRPGRKEAQEGIEAANLAFCLLVDTVRPDRLERAGEPMDECARRLR
jgi:hypothetical protein